jgi:hypothetical protein
MPGTHNLQPTAPLPRRLAAVVVATDARNGSVESTLQPNTFGLAGRIEALPGIRPAHTLLADGSLATSYFLDWPYLFRCTLGDAQLLCHVDCSGIMLPKLEAPDKEEVMRKGWVCCPEAPVMLFLPRNDIEMETLWQIVLLGYRFLTSRQAAQRRATSNETHWPKCSSTAKYWL